MSARAAIVVVAPAALPSRSGAGRLSSAMEAARGACGSAGALRLRATSILPVPHGHTSSATQPAPDKRRKCALDSVACRTARTSSPPGRANRHGNTSTRSHPYSVLAKH
eukprot:2588925-Prymnesium_polylepis.1